MLLVGVGGLGSPLALYLAAAGIGTLGLVDFDVVDLSNLQRQVLHGTRDVGRAKLESAADHIHDINPHVAIERFETRLTSANALEIIREFDLVIDGTDNFQTRYLVNDACFLTGRLNVYGSIFRFEGQASVFAAPGGPCYRCLFREPPPPGLVPSCAEGGVLGVLPGAGGNYSGDGSHQADSRGRRVTDWTATPGRMRSICRSARSGYGVTQPALCAARTSWTRLWITKNSADSGAPLRRNWRRPR